MWWGSVMTRWSKFVAGVKPWWVLPMHDHDGERKFIESVRDCELAIAPVIDAQTKYLVDRGELNGFSRQLRLGFESRRSENS